MTVSYRLNRMKCFSLTTLLLSGPIRLCVHLSSIPLLLISSLETFFPVHPCLFVFDTRHPPPLPPPSNLPAGLWIRVGRAVLDPRRVPATAGVALALVRGRGQVAATASGAWCRGAPRPGAGRWSRATCMPEACVLASELAHGDTGYAWRGAASGHGGSMLWNSQKWVEHLHELSKWSPFWCWREKEVWRKGGRSAGCAELRIIYLRKLPLKQIRFFYAFNKK